jgi:hypothetical protein
VGDHFSVHLDLKVVSRLQTIPEVTLADMLSNDDIERLLAIGEHSGPSFWAKVLIMRRRTP